MSKQPSGHVRLIACLVFIFSLVFPSTYPISLVEAAGPPTSITGNTVTGNFSTQVVPPSPGGNVYGIRGGQTAGTNLFHSFGQFNVGPGDTAQFQTSNLSPNAAIGNILGRINGQTSASQIFGTIDSATFYPSANLFLMNPYGFLFGPTATVNVGGMVAFTSADYLRLEGTGGNGTFYADPAKGSILTSAPVAAFGFLGSDPGAITVQGSQLSVTPGQSLSLVGGNITVQSGVLDDGFTVQPARLSAPGGQINIASVVSPGEILFPSLQSAPNVNGQSFTAMGNISLSEGALLDVSADAAGTVRIRGGQLTMDDATISANTGEQNGAPVAIDINVVGDMSISAIEAPALTAQTMGAGNAGEIRLTSANLVVNLAYPEFGEAINSSTLGAGNGGKVTLTTGDLTLSNTSPGFGVFIDSGTGGTGSGGDVTLRVRNGDFNGAFINTGDSYYFGSGSAGNLYIGGLNGMANSLSIPGSSISTEAFLAKAGSITLEAHNISITQNTFVSTISLLGQNPITINADQLSMDTVIRVQAQTIGPGNGGDITFTGKRLIMTNESAFITNTLDNGNAGNIRINASEYVRFADAPFASTPSGLFTNSIGREGTVTSGNAGSIEINTPRLEMTGGARISTTTQTAGRGGDVIVNASQGVFISGQRTGGPPLVNFGLGGSDGSGISTRSVGAEQCGPVCGNGGNQIINTGQLVLESGGILDSGTTGNGHGGNIQVNASSIAMSGTLIDGTPGGIFSRTIGTTPDAGAGGNIALTAQSVTISNGASVSASSTGPGNTGNIQINAGNQFTMTNSTVATEANQSGGGIIKITTNPNGTVQLTDSTISASVLDGNGGGGSVNIDPQYVVLENSQILANAVFGPGGNINITTNVLLPDNSSVISASSQFGQQGRIIIQSPVSPASGKIVPLGQKPLIETALVSQRCAAVADGKSSSFTVAGRDMLPAEPGGWLSSPLALAITELDGRPANEMGLSEPTEERPLLSLRRIAPPGFLTHSFAAPTSSDCRS